LDVDAVNGRRDRPPGDRVIAPADSVDGACGGTRGVVGRRSLTIRSIAPVSNGWWGSVMWQAVWTREGSRRDASRPSRRAWGRLYEGPRWNRGGMAHTDRQRGSSVIRGAILGEMGSGATKFFSSTLLRIGSREGGFGPRTDDW